MAKFNFDALKAEDKKTVIATCKANGTIINTNGVISKVPSDVEEFEESYVTTISSATVVLNNRGELMFHIVIKAPAKFLSKETGLMEDLNTLRMSPSNFFTDVNYITKDNPFADLDIEEDNHIFKVITRKMKRVGIALDISVAEGEDGFKSITDPMITDNYSGIAETLHLLFDNKEENLLD